MKQPNEADPQSQLNRRNFIKTTSTAAVGGSLFGLVGCSTNKPAKTAAVATSAVAVEKIAHAASGEPLKVVLIGCGGRGSGAADQFLTASKGGAKLIAMADVSQEHLDNKLKAIKERHPDNVDVPQDRQFVGWDAYQKAIPLADVCILATPPGIRPIHLEAAVNAGKNIFSEKPLAVDGPGVRRVLAAAEVAKQKNLKVAVGLQRHHHPAYMETIERVHAGDIGDILSMRVYWNGNRPWQHPRKPGVNEMQYQMDNWYYFTWLCGDHIVEQHIHNLDVGNWLKQGAHPIKARGMGGCMKKRTSDDGEIFDHHAVEFEYPDGTWMFSQCRQTLGCWNSVSEAATGTKGTVDMADGGNFIIKGPKPFQRNGHGINAWQEEHYPFYDAIINNKPYNELEYAAHSTLTAIMGRMATYSGKEITWEQALNSPVDLSPEAYSWDAKPQPAVGPDGLYPLPMEGNADWYKKIV